MAEYRAHATPTKDFFVRMITKDISLEDCILDLIDNCLDGARKVQLDGSADGRTDSYLGFHAKIDLNGSRFSIADNCGGIKISEAMDYAFHFGRRANMPSEGDYSIGLYGIGMKRAIFKIGNLIDIHSSTKDEAFRTQINVSEWLAREPLELPGKAPLDDWDFYIEDAEVVPGTGTMISVTELHQEISSQFGNPVFVNGLARIISRDYAQFLAKGFEISLGGKKIEGFPFTIRESDEFKPVRIQYSDEESGVEVEIIAGMAGTPPDDLHAKERSEIDYYGWFVLCNDRVVVAADKSDETVWGNSGFPTWHYQYYGFMGMVSFHSKDPNRLPWRTTKRDVDSSNAVYRRAVEKMKEATRPWIKYTQDRRADLEDAKKREAKAAATPLFKVAISSKFELPQIADTSNNISRGPIQYQKPNSEIKKVKNCWVTLVCQTRELARKRSTTFWKMNQRSSHLCLLSIP